MIFMNIKFQNSNNLLKRDIEERKLMKKYIKFIKLCNEIM